MAEYGVKQVLFRVNDGAAVTESQITCLQEGRSRGAGRALCCASVPDGAWLQARCSSWRGAQKTHHLTCGYMTGHKRNQGHDNKRRADCLL